MTPRRPASSRGSPRVSPDSACTLPGGNVVRRRSKGGSDFLVDFHGAPESPMDHLKPFFENFIMRAAEELRAQLLH